MKNLFSSDVYSLKKSKTILRHTFHAFAKKRDKLTEKEQTLIESNLYDLQQCLLEKNRSKSSALAKEVEGLFDVYLKKSQMQKIKDGTITCILALCAAVVIRQSIFELYEIPTGSMRPTLKEKDRLFVSKTNFGINIPLTTSHILFNPSLVQRNGIFVFTGKNMDIRDVNTRYFYLFPGKKQYIKRLMGKPGDTLYFYGGQIFGVDSEGNDITPLLQPQELKNIEHIPFLYFDGKVLATTQHHGGIFSNVTLLQMNEPVARMYLNGQNQILGEMLSICPSTYQCQNPLYDYYELWGFENFGMVRIVSRNDALSLTSDASLLPQAPYYLEIRHHPSLKGAKIARDERGRLRPMLGISTSLLPIDEDHMKTIFNNLYTARFVVSNGFAHRYGVTPSYSNHSSFLPRMPGIADGTYEFYHGKAYKIGWGGIATELDESHPLSQFSPSKAQLLFNLGIEFDTRFSPLTKFSPMPSRYAYFVNNDLYLMGAAIFKNGEKEISSFIDIENNRVKEQSQQNPYRPFIDKGPPLKSDGTLDKDFIMRYGLTLPPRMYLALGDNHAMSADSRDFGFVPEDNIRGAPDFIFWPPGPRWGAPHQVYYPLFTPARILVWSALTTSLLIYGIRFRRKNKLPLNIKKKT